MNVEGLENLFRAQFDDMVSPYLVSEESFLDYLNEAQEEACIRSRLLFDRTSGSCSIKVSTGKQSYIIDDSIYVIVDAFITDQSGKIAPLVITDRIELDKMFPEWRQESGAPTHLIQYDDHVELSPKPDNTFTLNIECHLLPGALSSLSCEPQINRANHRRLLHWVKYRAYDSQDNDIHDVKKSQHELRAFESIFGVRPRADNTRNQYSSTPHRNKVHIA